MPFRPRTGSSTDAGASPKSLERTNSDDKFFYESTRPFCYLSLYACGLHASQLESHRRCTMAASPTCSRRRPRIALDLVYVLCLYTTIETWLMSSR